MPTGRLNLIIKVLPLLSLATVLLEFRSYQRFNQVRDITPYSSDYQPADKITEVKTLVHFVREPTWVVPSRLQLLAQGAGGGVLDEVGLKENADFTEAQTERFKSDPVFYKKFVKAVEEVVNGNFPLVSYDMPITISSLTQCQDAQGH